MAGDWIPIRTNLHEDPAVVQVALATRLDVFAVVGRLLRLWSWANMNTVDGVANVSPTDDDTTDAEGWLDQFLGAPGFAKALARAGWLMFTSGGFIIPKFERWNSQAAKRRMVKSKQTQTRRCRQNVAKMSPPRGDRTATREEKSREEYKNPPSPPADAPTETEEPRVGEKYQTPNEHQQVFAAVVEVTGADPALNVDDIGDLTVDLLRSKFTPDQVREFGKQFHRICPWAGKDSRLRPTLNEVKKYISQLRAQKPQSASPDSAAKTLENRRRMEEMESQAASAEEIRRMARSFTAPVTNGVH